MQTIENQVNTDQHDEEFQSAKLRLGKKLRNARELVNLDPEDIAARLYVTVDTIIAIEKGDYSLDKHIVFTRGHIRNYARELGLSKSTIDKSFEKFGWLSSSNHTAKKTFNINKQSTAQDKHVRLVTYIIIVVIIILVLSWHQTHNATTESHFNSDISSVPSAKTKKISQENQYISAQKNEANGQPNARNIGANTTNILEN